MSSVYFNPAFDEWFTAELEESFLSTFRNSYHLLSFSKNLDDCLAHWVKFVIFKYCLDEQDYQQFNLSQEDFNICTFPSPNSIKAYNQFSSSVIRDWCRLKWSGNINNLFLHYKDKLDSVTCKYFILNDSNLAFELFQRLKHKEQTFEQIALTYASSSEQQKGLTMKKRILSNLPPAVIPIVKTSPENTIVRPFAIGPSKIIILEIGKFESASLDDSVVEKIYDLCFSDWLATILPCLRSRMEETLLG